MSKFLAGLRSILFKNGVDERVAEKNYYEEDLRTIITDMGYSGIDDPAFLEDHSDIIESIESSIRFSSMLQNLYSIKKKPKSQRKWNILGFL